MKSDYASENCFFCDQEHELMVFSYEFDSWFGHDCLVENFMVGSDEADIIAREYDLVLTVWNGKLDLVSKAELGA